MSLEIFNPARFFSKANSNQCLKPDDVLNQHHLSVQQKNMVLEAMLSEARDMIDISDQNSWDIFSKSSARQVEDILKAQAKLKVQMIWEPYGSHSVCRDNSLIDGDI